LEDNTICLQRKGINFDKFHSGGFHEEYTVAYLENIAAFPSGQESHKHKRRVFKWRVAEPSRFILTSTQQSGIEKIHFLFKK
jgi:hypothetical protein